MHHRHRPRGHVTRPPATPSAGMIVTSVVFLTQSPTFNGPVGGYTTLAVVGAPVAAAPVTSDSQPTSQDSANGSSVAASSGPNTSDSTPTPSSQLTSSPSVTPTDTVATTNAFSPSQAGAASPVASNNVSVSTKTGGMSSGAKAGVALGILLAIAAILMLALYLFKRKRNQAEAYTRNDDEKHAEVNAFVANRAPSTYGAKTELIA